MKKTTNLVWGGRFEKSSSELFNKADQYVQKAQEHPYQGSDPVLH